MLGHPLQHDGGGAGRVLLPRHHEGEAVHHRHGLGLRAALALGLAPRDLGTATRSVFVVIEIIRILNNYLTVVKIILSIVQCVLNFIVVLECVRVFECVLDPSSPGILEGSLK